MIWHPDSGLFAYTSGCIIVLEDLQTGTQRHLMGEFSYKLCRYMVHYASLTYPQSNYDILTLTYLLTQVGVSLYWKIYTLAHRGT